MTCHFAIRERENFGSDVFSLSCATQTKSEVQSDCEPFLAGGGSGYLVPSINQPSKRRSASSLLFSVYDFVFSLSITGSCNIRKRLFQTGCASSILICTKSETETMHDGCPFGLYRREDCEHNGPAQARRLRTKRYIAMQQKLAQLVRCETFFFSPILFQMSSTDNSQTPTQKHFNRPCDVILMQP